MTITHTGLDHMVNANTKKQATYSYAMISNEMRRDLDEPLSHFQQLRTTHFYRITPWNDMTKDDFSERTVQYKSAKELGEKLQSLNPDIVQGVDPFAPTLLPRVKTIVDYVSEHHKPLVLVSLENLPYQKKFGPLALAVAPLLKKYIDLASVIIYINEGARRNFLHFGADPSKMCRLMYGCWGVNTEEFSPNGDVADLNIGGQRVVLFIGRVHKMKGVFDLFEAFRAIAPHIPDVNLVYVGAGPALPKLKAMSKQHGLENRVSFTGTVKNRFLASYIRRAEVVVAPSTTTWLWAEQVGMVLLQAISCGVPVISTTSGSIPEFVKHNETGLLVPEHAPNALSKAMKQVLNDQALRNRLSSAARQYALQHFEARQNLAISEAEILKQCI